MPAALNTDNRLAYRDCLYFKSKTDKSMRLITDEFVAIVRPGQVTIWHADNRDELCLYEMEKVNAFKHYSPIGATEFNEFANKAVDEVIKKIAQPLIFKP